VKKDPGDVAIIQIAVGLDLRKLACLPNTISWVEDR